MGSDPFYRTSLLHKRTIFCFPEKHGGFLITWDSRSIASDVHVLTPLCPRLLSGGDEAGPAKAGTSGVIQDWHL